VLTTVAMATDKHTTAANATVVFSLGSVPVMTSCNSRGRAAVFREELQSCRRTDPAILEDRQPVKIQCENSASVIVNCSEL
jgi:hypothetical protein